MTQVGNSSSDQPVTKALEHLRRKGWVSLNQFALIVGLSYPTVIKYKADGRISCIRIGHTHRISVKEVKRFMTEGTEGSTTTTKAKAKQMELRDIKPVANYGGHVRKIVTERILAGLERDIEEDP